MKRLIVLLVLAIGPLALFGCGADKQPETEAALPVVRYINFKVYDPVYVAIDQGFFEKRGVQVEIVGDMIAGPNAIQAVSGGSAEAGLSSVPAIINANAAGLPIQGVVDVQTTFPGQELQKWYVLQDSPLQTFEDVSGKRYAVNIWRSSFHYTTLAAANAWGVDPETIDFQLLSFADQIPALINGEIDVAGLIPPYQGYLEMEYGDQVRVLWDDYDLYEQRHVSLIFVNRVWATYNPAEAQAFALGISDAIDWIEDHQTEAAEIVAAYTGIPAAAIGEYHFTEHGQVVAADVQAWLDWLIEYGDVTVDWLKVDDIATNQYLATKFE